MDMDIGNAILASTAGTAAPRPTRDADVVATSADDVITANTNDIGRADTNNFMNTDASNVVGTDTDGVGSTNAEAVVATNTLTISTPLFSPASPDDINVATIPTFLLQHGTGK